MSCQLLVHLRQAEGALVRLLGLAERRGYAPLSVWADPGGEETMVVHLTVSAARPVDLLVRQFDKLYDVKHVETIQ